jgi:methylmalonyl-CoA mutase cobalamin-binding domain/chain
MNEQIVGELREALIAGNIQGSEDLTKAALAQGIPAKTLLTEAIKSAADVIGQKYDDGEYFLANLVRCGDSFKVAIKQFEAHLTANPQGEADGNRVVIGTVEDDIHDIGKNLVVTFLQGDGFVVDDLGVDVSAQRLVDRAVETQADIIALSCLMSVTRNGVKKVCDELETRGLRDRYSVLVGGAATSDKWAKQVGCDGWAASATEASQVARSLIAARKGA